MAKACTATPCKEHRSDGDLCCFEIVENFWGRRTRVAIGDDNDMLLPCTNLHHVIQDHFKRRGETRHVTNHHLLGSVLRTTLGADDLQRETPPVAIFRGRTTAIASTTKRNQTCVILA